MPEIKHQQYIKAPIHACFDLARNVDIHIQTTFKTKEKAVAGVTRGLLNEGDTVTWEAIHFGIKQRLTSKITLMEPPHRFIDEMVNGAFHSFTHIHEFYVMDEGTLMIDHFLYKSPFGLIGKAADKLFLEKYMEKFIGTRANELKKIAQNRV